MSDTPDVLAERALKILNEGDPRDARKLLLEAVEAAPDRADLLHALAVVQLQLGESEQGFRLVQEAIARAEEQLADPARRDQAATMLEGFLLTAAAACEDLGDAANAVGAYQRVLQLNPGQPRARAGMAYALLAWGLLDEGCKELATYIEEDRDEDPFIEGAKSLLENIQKFRREDIHPREFLAAHQGSYKSMFDHYAAEQEKLGWIAEAARMKRGPDGRVVPSIPEGARAYAGVRVDLVDPQTGQVGQVGDQPMVVALADYQPLARTNILFSWRDLPFDLRVSSQTPWDQLPILFALKSPGKAAINAMDQLVGDWYGAGFEGAFGHSDSGRFHYVSDPEVQPDYRVVVYHFDLGRADLRAIDDLIRRLTVFHDRYALEKVIIGRGYL